MNKKNFDNLGLQLLLQELYAMPDQLLQEEALAANNNFSGWLEAHFLLTSSQLEDLQDANQIFLNDMGASVGHFLAQRSPITLYKNATPTVAAKGGGRGKLYEKAEKATTTYIPELGLSVSESLEISISYLGEPES